ncbi:MAG TPA: DNA polymerase III, partial [Magnetospirillum sp.]|nr:DNA polymerase III [Magnetospirillum sp.]
SHDPLPDGTRLTLEVVGAPIPPSPAAAPPARPEGLTAQGWPALSEALDVLATANQPQALEQLLRVIPQADARLAASMVAFTGAIRNGDTKAVLPDSTVRGLEKAGKKDVASRLKADLEALGEDSGRPVGNGDWRVYAMPFLGGGTIEPVRLFVRKTGDEDGARRDGGGRGNDHRFVVDLNLTQLGRLQLDGLVRREDKLFDLIIRTGEPMSADMRRDILGIFSQASELVGTKGTVSFQAGGRWIDFPPAPPAPTRIEV